jgi:hypothetical protein
MTGADTISMDELAPVKCGRVDPAIEARKFLAENPEAYGLLVKFARRDIAEGTS